MPGRKIPSGLTRHQNGDYLSKRIRIVSIVIPPEPVSWFSKNFGPRVTTMS